MFFREERFDVSGALSKIILETGDQTLEGRLKNISQYGCSAFFNEEILLENVQIDAKIIIEQSLVFQGPAVLIKDSPTEYRFQLKNEGSKVSQIKALLKARKGIKAEHFEEDIVANEFKILVSDFCYLISSIRIAITEEEEYNTGVANNLTEKAALDTYSIEKAVTAFQGQIFSFYTKFTTALSKVEKKQIPLYKQYFRVIFHPLFLRAQDAKTAFDIYNDSSLDLFGKFFNQVCLNEPMALANYNRSQLIATALSQKLKEIKKFKVAIIGAGPCREVEKFLLAPENVDALKDAKIDILCVDQENQALRQAQRRLYKIAAGFSSVKVRFITGDYIVGLIKKREPLWTSLKNSDVIICPGQFDYLSDKIATAVLKSFSEIGHHKTAIIIGNVAKDHPNRFSIAFLTEWELVQRDISMLKELLPKELRAKKLEFQTEQSGIHILMYLA